MLIYYFDAKYIYLEWAKVHQEIYLSRMGKWACMYSNIYYFTNLMPRISISKAQSFNMKTY